MVTGLYDALKDAGAKEELARSAAQEVADYETRLADMKSDLQLIKWMVGFVLASTIGILMVLLGG